MPELYGIENVKKVFLLLIDAGNEAGILAENNDLKWYEKIMKSPIIQIVEDIVTVVGVDWKLFPKEITDISAVEMQELNGMFVAKFDIPEDEVEEIVKKVFAAVILLIENAITIIQLSKGLKKKS